MSVLLNGSLEGFLSRGYGVKQGKLLSLIIFCLAKDFLSCYIARLVEEGSITHISSPRGFSALSYLFLPMIFDFFCHGTRQNIRDILDVFAIYRDLSD